MDLPRVAVGAAIQEAALHTTLVSSASRLLRPGRGYRLLTLQEVEARHGRPDVLLVAAQQNTVAAMRTRGIEFRSESEARAAGFMVEGIKDPRVVAARLGLSVDRASELLRAVARFDPRHVEHTAAAVHDSVLIEAKVKDWRGAAAQLRRYRGVAHAYAIAMPRQVLGRVDRAYVERSGLGLVGVEAGLAFWVRQPRTPARSRPDSGGRLWLAEMAARSLWD